MCPLKACRLPKKVAKIRFFATSLVFLQFPPTYTGANCAKEFFMSRFINLVVLAFVALVVFFSGCATTSITKEGKFEAAATATPRGTAIVIDAIGRYKMTEAQAACMQDPAKCGWFAGVMVVDQAGINYQRRYQLTQFENRAGATIVLDQELVRAYNQSQGDLEQSRRDFRLQLESGE